MTPALRRHAERVCLSAARGLSLNIFVGETIWHQIRKKRLIPPGITGADRLVLRRGSIVSQASMVIQHTTRRNFSRLEIVGIYIYESAALQFMSNETHVGETWWGEAILKCFKTGLLMKHKPQCTNHVKEKQNNKPTKEKA